jgi:hypothetical protein
MGTLRRTMLIGAMAGTLVAAMASPAAAGHIATRWRATESMEVERAYAGVAVLRDGDVLVIGGSNQANRANADAERFDVRTETWTRTAPLLAPRAWTRAVALRDGRVLVVGGSDLGADLESERFPKIAEMYDAVHDRWLPAGSLSEGREDPQAVVLRDGRVLVIGGNVEGDAKETADLYDPRTKTWKPASPMGYGRWNFSATLLRDGRVLVAGGLTDGWSVIQTTELYDPSSDTWTPGPDLTQPRHTHAAVRLRDGRVLVLGTYWGGDPASTEIYDPASNTWTAAASMGTPRAYLSAHLLPDGNVLAIGGNDTEFALASTEIYVTCRDQWRPAGTMTAAHASQASAITKGHVIVAGGVYGSYGEFKSTAVDMLLLPRRHHSPPR